jgi:hypothetical protein
MAVGSKTIAAVAVAMIIIVVCLVDTVVVRSSTTTDCVTFWGPLYFQAFIVPFWLPGVAFFFFL